MAHTRTRLLSARQERLLQRIVEDYITLAQPVASQYLAKQERFAISPATIRNEMAVLEGGGYIYQPHTSAGRLPTPVGLSYYLARLMQPHILPQRERKRLADLYDRHGMRGLAREAARYCKAAMVMVEDTSTYYTGFSQLFAEPEASDGEIVRAISGAVDEFERVADFFMEDAHRGEPKIYIGEQNPLGGATAAIMIGDPGRRTLIGALTHLRTNYSRTVGMLQSLAEYF